SLLLVRRMPDLALLPAHGPGSPSVHARVDELLEHHDARLRAMLAGLSDGPCTAYQVAGAIRWTSRNKQLAALDPINQRRAVGETLSHADLLVARRLAAAHNDGEVELFRPPEQIAKRKVRPLPGSGQPSRQRRGCSRPRRGVGDGNLRGQ